MSSSHQSDETPSGQPERDPAELHNAIKQAKRSVLSDFLSALGQKHGAEAVRNFMDRHLPEEGKTGASVTLRLNTDEIRVLKDLSYDKAIALQTRRALLKEGSAKALRALGFTSIAAGALKSPYTAFIAGKRHPEDYMIEALLIVGGITGITGARTLLYSAEKNRATVELIEGGWPQARNPAYKAVFEKAQEELGGKLFAEYLRLHERDQGREGRS